MDALDLDDAPSNTPPPPAFKLAKLASYEIKAYPPFSVVKNKQSVVVVAVAVVVDGKRMGEIVRIRPLMGSVSMSGNRFSSSLPSPDDDAALPLDGDPSASAALAGC